MPLSSQTTSASAKAPDLPEKLWTLRTPIDRLLHDGLRLENAFHECRLRITTHGTYDWKAGDWARNEHLYYYATPYRRIFRILKALHLRPSDTFIDLGCGKGRVTCCASLYPVREVIGIDDVQALCTTAENNLKRLRGKRAPARILHGKAEQFEYTAGTVIYMFHPFGPKTLAAVLSRIQMGLRINPRDLKIVYVNPVHEYVLQETKWLELYDRWPMPRHLSTNFMHCVSFWRWRDACDRLAAP